MNEIKNYVIKGKYNIKTYMGNYDKKDFYAQMGDFFADRDYRKKLPYLVNEIDKVWYLIYDRNKFVGFFGIKICNNNTLISDIYIEDAYDKADIFEYMANYLVELYYEEYLKVLTKFKDEQQIWLHLGFEIIGYKGNYAIMIKEGRHEAD